MSIYNTINTAVVGIAFAFFALCNVFRFKYILILRINYIVFRFIYIYFRFIRNSTYCVITSLGPDYALNIL